MGNDELVKLIDEAKQEVGLYFENAFKEQHECDNVEDLAHKATAFFIEKLVEDRKVVDGPEEMGSCSKIKYSKVYELKGVVNDPEREKTDLGYKGSDGEESVEVQRGVELEEEEDVIQILSGQGSSDAEGVMKPRFERDFVIPEHENPNRTSDAPNIAPVNTDRIGDRRKMAGSKEEIAPKPKEEHVMDRKQAGLKTEKNGGKNQINPKNTPGVCDNAPKTFAGVVGGNVYRNNTQIGGGLGRNMNTAAKQSSGGKTLESWVNRCGNGWKWDHLQASWNGLRTWRERWGMVPKWKTGTVTRNGLLCAASVSLKSDNCHGGKYKVFRKTCAIAQRSRLIHDGSLDF
nr:hypothetical protein Iba_chr14dCG12620 [Ipomoea batatas]